MHIEIRNKNGACIADLKGELATHALANLMTEGFGVTKNRTIQGKGTMKVVEIVENTSIKVGEAITIWLFIGAYIKRLE